MPTVPPEIELVSGSTVGISEPMVDGDDVYWLESRSAEGGRRTLLRRGPDGATHELTPQVYVVPEAIDAEVARLKLAAMGITLDEMTAEQKEYVSSWQHGT